jgi:hypothetical protein
MPSSQNRRLPRIQAALRCLATKACEKCGLNGLWPSREQEIDHRDRDRRLLSGVEYDAGRADRDAPVRRQIDDARLQIDRRLRGQRVADLDRRDTAEQLKRHIVSEAAGGSPRPAARCGHPHESNVRGARGCKGSGVPKNPNISSELLRFSRPLATPLPFIPSPRADLFRVAARLGARGKGTVSSHTFAENAH